jgi:hypothetical protein
MLWRRLEIDMLHCQQVYETVGLTSHAIWYGSNLRYVGMSRRLDRANL